MASTRPLSPVLFGVVLSLLVVCKPTPAAGPVDVECGSTTPTHDLFDARAFECFWSAYTAGRAARLAMTPLTVEGDPVPATVTYTPASGFVVTHDARADNYAGAGGRRVWTWRCSTITKHPWATDPSRYNFELSGCTGDGSTTGFP